MIDALVLETAEKAFAASATYDAVQAAEVARWAPDIWEAAAGIGLPWISVPEDVGGVGGTLADAIAVLSVAGSYAAPIPLAETGILAGWLLASVRLPVGERPLTVVPGRREDNLRITSGRVSGMAHRVPWAGAAERIVALVDGNVVVVSTSSSTIREVCNLAGEPRDTVIFDDVRIDECVLAPAGVDSEALAFRGALSRAALMAGALRAMAHLTVSYTSERKQFGRPVSSFQAVQALIVRCAEEAALVDIAVQVAAREADRGEARFEIAAAKSLADDAALVATRSAHQAHGAMGLTQEYGLHHLSRRLWAWRTEYGAAAWPARLGQSVVDAGPDLLYRTIAEGSHSGIVL